MHITHLNDRRIKSINVNYDRIIIELVNGRSISAPLDYYPHFEQENRHDRALWESVRWQVWQQLAHERRLHSQSTNQSLTNLPHSPTNSSS